MMEVFGRFYPDEWVFSAYAVNYEGMYETGFRGLLFDVDNTLVPHGMPADGAAKELFSRLRGIGFQTCLLSNNQALRVRPFAEEVGSPFLENAHKPSPSGYLEACRRMGTSPETTVYVGDQLFTDIWGAKRAHVRAVLVLPVSPAEEIQIILKRRLEWIVLASYKRYLRRRGITDYPGGHFQRPGRARITGRFADPADLVHKDER